MIPKRRLVHALDVKSEKELKDLSPTSKINTLLVLSRVLFDDRTYEEAGKMGTGKDMSKHSVYEALKRLYLKKFNTPYKGGE